MLLDSSTFNNYYYIKWNVLLRDVYVKRTKQELDEFNVVIKCLNVLNLISGS